jgi:uncharacterized membrane protein YadS
MKERFIYKEDFWSIVIGILLLLIGFLIFINTSPENLDQQKSIEERLVAEEETAPYKTIQWYQQYDQLKNIKASKTKAGKFLGNLTTKPSTWGVFPVQSFYLSEDGAFALNKANEVKYEEKKAIAAEALRIANVKDAEAALAKYSDDFKNEAGIIAIDKWRVADADLQAASKKISVKPYNKLPWILLFGFGMMILFGTGARVIQGDFIKFGKGFLFVFFIGIISYFLAAQVEAKSIGFGYAAWAILIGLIISNTIGTPKWVKPALLTEMYIKTGLVVLGAEILLGKILAIGLPGIFVAWIVTPIVLISTYWFGQKVLKIGSKTLNMTISADMSVCGVSAAVATAAACKATKEELTIAVGLSMIFTSIMMIVLPAFINAMGMPEILGGAWIGGTIDATGAVVAAGAFLGEKALSVAATIKMIQNVLIGIIAFGVAVYFSGKSETGEKVKFSWREIWMRFPKFIIGFLGASVIFSLIYQFLGENNAYTFIDQGVIGGFTKNIRGWLFCIAFVSIGLSINFKDLKKHFIGGKPLILYVCGQAFNLGLTLLMAYLMFYKVFPAITNSI